MLLRGIDWRGINPLEVGRFGRVLMEKLVTVLVTI